jgi:AcrR family transcriptional regulator
MTEAPRSPLRRKLRAQIADSILDAAEQVALELGIGGMTTAAVAARAGVAVGTLYNYYPDGDGILAALFRARRATLMPLITAAATTTRTLPFEAGLRELVRRLLVAFASHARFVQLAAQVDRDGSRTKPRDAALRDATIAALERVMREGVRRRLFTARQAASHARILHGALRSLFLWRASSSEPITESGELLVETFLRGVLPR